MALYAFDGTWDEEKQNDTAYANTNVCRFFDAYQANTQGMKNVYEQGIGTKLGVAGHLIGGAFGAGELDRLLRAYRQLCANVTAGDKNVDIVGFSRGAATCLDFINLVEQWHIKDPSRLDALWRLDNFLSAPKVADPPSFRFVGLFDVVGAFGLGAIGGDLPLLNLGHHLNLPSTRVQYCFHAMALDENRPSFNVIRVAGAYEVWFRGVHSDIGGGDENRGLNDITLSWMFRKALAAGLPITAKNIEALQPDPATAPCLHNLPPFWRPLSHSDRIHYSVSDSHGCRPIFGDAPRETAQTELVAQAATGMSASVSMK